jgi:hypothetical protein
VHVDGRWSRAEVLVLRRRQMIDGRKVESSTTGLSQFLLESLMNPKSMKSNPSEIVLTKLPAPSSLLLLLPFLLFKFAVCSIVNITEKHSTELTPLVCAASASSTVGRD